MYMHDGIRAFVAGESRFVAYMPIAAGAWRRSLTLPPHCRAAAGAAGSGSSGNASGGASWGTGAAAPGALADASPALAGGSTRMEMRTASLQGGAKKQGREVEAMQAPALRGQLHSKQDAQAGGGAQAMHYIVFHCIWQHMAAHGGAHLSLSRYRLSGRAISPSGIMRVLPQFWVVAVNTSCGVQQGQGCRVQGARPCQRHGL